MGTRAAPRRSVGTAIINKRSDATGDEAAGASIGELLHRITDDVKTIASSEVELVKLELAQAVKRSVRDAAFVLFGAIVGLIGISLLAVVAVVALEPVLPPLWLRLLIMSTVYLAIGGGLGASATGGSWVTGAIIGGASGAFVGGILGPWAGSSAGGQAFLRAATGVLGNAMGQGTRIGDKCFCGFNMGSLAGSAVGGALAGVRAASIAANSYSGSLASQVAQRCMAGTSGSATSTASGVVGTAMGAGGCSC